MTELVKWEAYPHVTEMQQFSREALLSVIEHAAEFTAAMMDDKNLPRKSRPYRLNAEGEKKRRMVRTLFYQPSSRTEATFDTAAMVMQCARHNVKDPSKLSSAAKGESLEYAIAAYTWAGGMRQLRNCDCVVIRHKEKDAANRARKVIATALGDGEQKVSLPVINAGDGKEGQHPTQTLVDFTTIFMMRNHGMRFLKDSTFLIPGESHRSRVVNSLLYGLGKFGQENNIKVIFCSPDGAGPKQELLQYIARHGVNYEFRPQTAFRDSIPEATTVYITRPQTQDDDESPPPNPVDRQSLVFRAQDLSRLQPGAFVMHPLPINENPDDPPAEIEASLFPLAMAGDKRCIWLRQSHMGLPVRAALLDLIFAGLDEESDKLYGRVGQNPTS